MTAAVSCLDEKRLRRLLEGVGFVRRVVVLDATSSTNDVARRLAREGAPGGTIVLADRQTAGRGRLGRPWYSAPGIGLYISVIVRPPAPAARAIRWTLTATLAACEACREVSGASVTIQWPNDLCHHGRKLAGTLVEVRSAGPTMSDMVVGTGFNVNHGAADFPSDLDDRATSLRLATGGEVERERLVAAYLRRFGELAARADAGGWDEVRDAWSSLAPGTRGCRVVVRPGGDAEGRGPFPGITRGIDDVGGLRVEKPDGTIEVVHLGESIDWREV